MVFNAYHRIDHDLNNTLLSLAMTCIQQFQVNSVPTKGFFFLFDSYLVRKQEGFFLILDQFVPQKESEVLNLAHGLIRVERVKTGKICRCYMSVS